MHGNGVILPMDQHWKRLMKLLRTVIAVGSMLVATVVLADERREPKPKLIELINQDYIPKVSGKIVMRRKLLPLLDEGIFVYPYHDRSCIGELIVTIAGPVNSCKIGNAFAEEARFVRMVKGSVEFVCILYGPDECHRVH